MSCHQLFPVPPCSFHGDCQQLDQGDDLPINLTSAINLEIELEGDNLWLQNFSETCVCEAGWSQTNEMTLYFLTQEEIEAGLGMCTQNEKFLRALYCVALLISVLGFLNQVYRVVTLKKCDRLAFFIVGLVISISLCVYRLIHFETAVYGKDFVFTFFVGMIAGIGLISTAFYVNRYLKYLTTKIHFTNPKALVLHKAFKRLEKPLFTLDLILIQFFWVGVLFEDKRKHGRLLLTIAFWYAAIRMFYTAVLSWLTLTHFLNDMQDFTQSQISLTGSSRLFKVENSLDGVLSVKNDFAEKLSKGLIRRTKRMRIIFVVTCLLTCVCFLLPAASPYMLLQLGYVIPFTFTLFTLPNFGGVKKKENQTTANKKVKKNNNAQTSPFEYVASLIESSIEGDSDNIALEDEISI